MFYKTAITALALAGLTVGALAHTGATGVVKERMDAMKAMGEAIKRIKPMMAGEAAYDAAAIRTEAQAIAADAGTAMTDKFPEGSTAHPSETLPRTWQEWDRFTSLAAQLETAAEGLAIAAGNGLQGGQHMTDNQSGMMGGQSNMMGGTMMTGDSMMGDGMMGNGMAPKRMTADHIGQMPADRAFVMLTQTCSACHDRYRQDDD